VPDTKEKDMIKRIIATAAIMAAACTAAFAGGYLTNTNQSISFLRQPAQNAVVSVNGAYFNPAGVGFLDEGWHLSFGVQNIHQTREIESTYAPFALGTKNDGKATHTFKGTTVVPILPTFDLAYVANEHWFGSFHFGVMGGGGKADFPDGLGSFESQIAILPFAVNALATGLGSPVTPFSSYGVDIDILGEQYYFGGQLNIGYRVNDALSFSAGLRANYITCSYDATIANITFNGVAAAQALGAVLTNLGMTVDSNTAAAVQAMFGDRKLDCVQKGFAWTPIVGVHYKAGDLDLAARYEFNTSIRLKNDTESDAGLAQYADGKDGMANDMGALLSLGASYTLFDKLHLNLGFNNFFDKQSKVYNPATDANDKTDLINKNAYEILGGVEYDINDKWTVSGGVQYTHFDWGADKEFISDMAFNPISTSAGLGCRYNFSEKLSFDLAVFNTFYHHLLKEQADYNGNGASTAAKLSGIAGSLPATAQSALVSALAQPGSDNFYRTSFVVGFGVNYKF